MAVMFSSPKMIMMFIIGIFIFLLFFGSIGIALYQATRGRWRIDYDSIAAKNALEHSEKKRRNKKES